MTTQIDLEGAIQKARRKRQIGADLADLPSSVQRDILADLLAELEEPSERTVEVTPRAPTVGPRERKPAGAAPAAPETKAGTPDAPALDHRAQVVEVLRGSPRLPIKDLAVKVYGKDDERGVSKVRAILTDLQRQKRVKRISFGKWEAVTPK